MKHFFLDTSALVKRYSTETGSTWIHKLINDPDHRITISRLTETEISAALTRRLNLPTAKFVLNDFDQDITQFLNSIEITNEIVDHAVQLARTQRLRGCDSLQLASALEIAKIEPSAVFVCSDIDLLTAAAAKGLQTENPELYP